jgi:signal transduction histidine kinase
LPSGTEERIAKFTELVGMAIANAESREALALLADEQAALRRVATLVAGGARPDAVFGAVTLEVARIFDAEVSILTAYDSDWTASLVAGVGWKNADIFHVGRRWGAENTPEEMRETLLAGRALRIDDWEVRRGEWVELLRTEGIRATVGAPIFVEGRIWGFLGVGSRHGPLPAGTEGRITKFTELVGSAVANAESRAELKASRARLVVASDEARRRIERDLHDAAQQRLVHTVVTLKLARRALRQGDDEAESLIAEALEHAETANCELREVAHGILPAVLSRAGLRAAVDSLTSRTSLPVDVAVPEARFPGTIEATAYFIVSEALTNAVKHSGASRLEVAAALDDGMLKLEVHDDGAGGATLSRGSGLIGLQDRVAALDGRFEVESPPGAGTRIVARLPLGA